MRPWSMIRIATHGPHIRVWFNRMHPSADPENGLRIDVRDERSPVLSGNVGVRAHMLDACFDNVVVLPVDWDRGMKGAENQTK